MLFLFRQSGYMAIHYVKENSRFYDFNFKIKLHLSFFQKLELDKVVELFEIFCDLLLMIFTNVDEMPKTVGKKRSTEVPCLESKRHKQSEPECVSKRQ